MWLPDLKAATTGLSESRRRCCWPRIPADRTAIRPSAQSADHSCTRPPQGRRRKSRASAMLRKPTALVGLPIRLRFVNSPGQQAGWPGSVPALPASEYRPPTNTGQAFGVGKVVGAPDHGGRSGDQADPCREAVGEATDDVFGPFAGAFEDNADRAPGLPLLLLAATAGVFAADVDHQAALCVRGPVGDAAAQLALLAEDLEQGAGAVEDPGRGAAGDRRDITGRLDAIRLGGCRTGQGSWVARMCPRPPMRTLWHASPRRTPERHPRRR